MRNAWLVPGIPFFSFLIVGLFIRPLSEKAAGWVATAALFVSAFFAYSIAWDYFSHFGIGHEGPALVPWAFEWLRYQDHLTATIGTLIDPISILLMVVVTTVSALVHLYSIGYMAGDDGYGRYFTFLNLFSFSMLGLVVAPNIVQMFVCWELVGVSSFLLIGYYYRKPSAVAAGKKAFIVTRFADLGFLIGILILGYFGIEAFPHIGAKIQQEMAGLSSIPIQAIDFAFINHPATAHYILTTAGTVLGLSTLAVACILIFMGCAGKSAMFPLHIWLPDAMEGPTPVSALIHAATMVVAGVYLVARLFPSFAAAGTPLDVVAFIGTFTCAFAAIIACTQDDIKRVLAFSTLSQLGYMMLALGVATAVSPLGHTASMFHLFTHAFFKALLFLAAGALIHGVHSNEIWDMGGLRKKLPVTHLTFLAATLAIAGVPPLSGFFSKDEILRAAVENHHPIVFGVALFVAGLTAFYMFRIYFISFWGDARSEKAEHAHEAPAVMLIPLIALALLAIFAGFVPMGEYLGTSHGGHHGIHWNIAIPATLAGLIGIALSAFMYTGTRERYVAVARALGGMYTVVKNKFYVDEVYLFVTKNIIFHYIARPIAWFDRHIVDGAINLYAWLTGALGRGLKPLQTGQVQTYSAWWISGAVFFIILLWMKLS
ncbi:NADH-quinone oxidoreductase subunit L [bacterium]|nr:NADH-quinone oxidoreductase subunit L [bacterium]